MGYTNLFARIVLPSWHPLRAFSSFLICHLIMTRNLSCSFINHKTVEDLKLTLLGMGRDRFKSFYLIPNVA